MWKPSWWRWVWPSIVVLVLVSLVPLSLVYYARTTNQKVSRISIIPNMDKQPKFESQTANSLFLDGRAMRPPVEGTIARGHLQLAEHYYTGIVDGAWADSFPAQVEIDEVLMARGQERYDIFCGTCHGLDGAGGGLVSLRAEELAFEDSASNSWIAPISYHTEAVRQRPVGHIYNTISNGIRSMPAYGTQVPVEDRWAIVAYVRALQLSQWAPIMDAPNAERELLQSMPPLVVDDSARSDYDRVSQRTQELLEQSADLRRRLSETRAGRDGIAFKIDELEARRREIAEQLENATEEDRAEILAQIEAERLLYLKQEAEMEAESRKIAEQLRQKEAEVDANGGAE